MPEAIPFLTGKQLSTEDFVTIAENTAVDDYTPAEAAAKNRRWDLTAGGIAYLPRNPYRAFITVDNSSGLSTIDVYDSVFSLVQNIPPGVIAEFSDHQKNILMGAHTFSCNSVSCTVIESSYV